MSAANTFRELRAQRLDRLRELGLGAYEAALAPLLRPCIRLWSRPSRDDDAALGATRIGGDPDVPAGFVWPEDEDGPLRFGAQLDLRQLAAFDVEHRLPAAEGLLSIFVSEYGDRAVVHLWPDVAALAPRRGPVEPFRVAGVDPRLDVQVPPVSSKFVAKDAPAKVPGSAERIGGSLVAVAPDLYGVYWDDFWLPSEPRPQDPEQGRHQCLGYMQSSQWELQQPDEEVLFCLATDDYAEMEWGDAQDLWLLIPREDLAVGRFDRVRVRL